MKNLMILLVVMAMSLNVNAQSFGSRLKNKVLNKLENKAEEKIDKAVNNAIDKPVDKTEEKVKESVKKDNSSQKSSSSNSQQTPSEDDMSKYMEMFGGGTVSISDYPDVKDVQASNWTGSLEMVYTTQKGNGKISDDGNVTFYIGNYDVVIKSDDMEDGRIIINRKKGVTIVLTESSGQKTGMVMDMKQTILDTDAVYETADVDLDDINIQVFKNERKTINGYNCHKMVVSDDEFKTVAWVTDELNLDMSKMMGLMNVRSKENSKYEEKFGNITAWPIKSTTTDKKSGEISTMETKNVKKGALPASITSTDGYQLMKLPSFGQ